MLLWICAALLPAAGLVEYALPVKNPQCILQVSTTRTARLAQRSV
jgi:predicted small integral membrane protein